MIPGAERHFSTSESWEVGDRACDRGACAGSVLRVGETHTRGPQGSQMLARAQGMAGGGGEPRKNYCNSMVADVDEVRKKAGEG